MKVEKSIQATRQLVAQLNPILVLTAPLRALPG